MKEEASMDQLFLEKVHEAIENNLANENFGVDELAKEIGISRSQLHRRLNSINGQSASQMIREFRLKKAYEMLQKKVATASEISYQVGFSSPSYFNTCFSEFFGYPPGKVKRIKSFGIAKKISVSKKSIFISFAILMVIVLVFVIYIIVSNINTESTKLLITDKSIAVLPFKSLSPDPEKQYLADGVMDAIILHLSRIEDLKVTDRTSVEQYRETDKTASIICQELDVGYLLEGSFQKYGDQARLIVQLIKPGKEGHIWGEEYDRNWQDIFVVQSEVAQTIARELKVEITPQEKQLIEKIPTLDLTAYNFYLQGRDLCREYDRDYLATRPTNTTKLEKAEYLLRKALECDSTFAPAYKELAWVVKLSPWKFSSEKIHLDSLMSLANIALTYDDQLSEAYALRGFCYHRTGEPEKALAEYNTALKFNPNDWLALKNKSLYYIFDDLPRSIEYLYQALWRNPEEVNTQDILEDLIWRYKWAGFLDKAEFYNKERFKLDRDSSKYYATLSYLEFDRGNWDSVIETCNKRLELNPTDLDAMGNIGAAYLLLEEYEKALNTFENLIDEMTISGEKIDILFFKWIGCTYMKNGNRELADFYIDQELDYWNRRIEQQLDYWNRRIGNRPIPWCYFSRAAIYAFRGMKEEALTDLMEYVDVLSIWHDDLSYLKSWPFFDNIRDEPEFQQIVRDVEAKHQAEQERVRQWLEENVML